MLTELKFCQGAIGRRELIPAMTHFRIRDGFVRSFDGALALCSPISCDLDCIPKAVPMIKAIGLCDETILLSMSDNKKLRIASGPFKALIDCIETDMPAIEPEGDIVDLDGAELVKAFKTLSRFVGNDASRPWTNGILLRGQSAFATNNVCLVEYWLGFESPIVVNIPQRAIDEILRIGEPPTHAQVDANSMTFHFTGDRWLRTQLYETQWPDLSKILDVDHNASPVDERLYAALEYLQPFADELNRVHIGHGTISTHSDLDNGAEYEIPGLQMKGIYKINMLQLLEGVADKADFTRYPKPTLFYGDRLRGAIVGLNA